MKKFLTLTIVVLMSSMSFYTSGQSFNFAISEYNGGNISCRSCYVQNAAQSVGPDIFDYSRLKITANKKENSFVFQNFIFSEPTTGESELTFLIADDNLQPLNKETFQQIEFYTLINDESNHDTINGNEVTIRQIGYSGLYLAQIKTSSHYNSAGVKLKGGKAGETSKLRVYAVYYNTTTLPVELIYFRGSNDATGTFLEWATLSETNNQYFTVEKSMDGINFSSIAIVPGKGNSERLAKYSFTDEISYMYEKVYYRLKHHNYTGGSKDFEIISVSSQIN
jgi:hypothetical protein